MSLYERNLELLKENFRIRKFITTLEKVKWKNKLSLDPSKYFDTKIYYL